MKKMILIVAVLLVGCQQDAPSQTTDPVAAPPASMPAPQPKPQPSPQPKLPVIDSGTSIDGLIEKALSKTIGKPASYHARTSGEHIDMQLICGKPVAPDGKWLDYSDTRYNEAILDGAFEDSFCALMRNNGKQYELIEFDFGSTDAPVFDWLERYGLPLSILKSKP